MAGGQVERSQQDGNPGEAEQQLSDDGHYVADLTVRHPHSSVNDAHLFVGRGLKSI
jgi:hypothetical protein